MRQYLHSIGLNLHVYWFANLVSDYFMFMLSGVALLLLVYPMDLKIFESELSEYVWLTAAFGYGIITFTYLMSHIFTNSTTSFRMTPIIYLTIGFIVPIIIKGVVYVFLGCSAYHTSEVVFSFLPVVNYYNALYDKVVSSFPMAQTAREFIGQDEIRSIHGEHPTNPEITKKCDSLMTDPYTCGICLIIGGTVAFILTILIDMWKQNKA